jgi:hypothetical protein
VDYIFSRDAKKCMDPVCVSVTFFRVTRNFADPVCVSVTFFA